MLFNFLLVIQALVSATMVTFILLQRSEGGGLGVGGSPSGVMSARGAADFLTRGTAILATLFVSLSIVLAGLATVQRGPIQVDAAHMRRQAPAAPAAPLANPLAPPAQQGAPAQPSNGSVPLAQ